MDTLDMVRRAYENGMVNIDRATDAIRSVVHDIDEADAVLDCALFELEDWGEIEYDDTSGVYRVL